MKQTSWKEIADSLKEQAADATAEQHDVARRLGVHIPTGTPSPVAAVILRHRIGAALQVGFRECVEIPSSLHQLEDQLEVARTESLITDTNEELSAWFAARYSELTSRGLRSLQPQRGDVVVTENDPEKKLIVSSVGKQGRVYMRGGGGASSWPNHLTLISRQGVNDGHDKLVTKVLNSLSDGRDSSSFSVVAAEKLRPYELDSSPIPPEAIRKLEGLLESSEVNENRYQEFLQEYPAFLRFLVPGNWTTYVIPKQRLGSEYETDFLIMGLSSLGPQWVAVELESPKHSLLRKDGNLRQEVIHAIDQIGDWRDWLANNISYAKTELGLQGITSRLPGVVIIGRDDVRFEREPARSRIQEERNIQVHSWDWLLRNGQQSNDQNSYIASTLRNTSVGKNWRISDVSI